VDGGAGAQCESCSGGASGFSSSSAPAPSPHRALGTAWAFPGASETPAPSPHLKISLTHFLFGFELSCILTSSVCWPGFICPKGGRAVSWHTHATGVLPACSGVFCPYAELPTVSKRGKDTPGSTWEAWGLLPASDRERLLCVERHSRGQDRGHGPVRETSFRQQWAGAEERDEGGPGTSGRTL
jgi:hypothetical protein